MYKHRSNSLSRSGALLSLVLIAAPLITGCTLNATQWEAIAPSAAVTISPNPFCLGETLTVSWDGGPQVGACGSPRDVSDCKGASLSVLPSVPAGLSFGLGFDDTNLNGSRSGPADILSAYTASYQVQWDGWAGYRSYREPDPSGEGWIGVVRAYAEAWPLGPDDTQTVAYADTFVCDEVTHTWVVGRRDHSSFVYRESGYPHYIQNGDLSACAVITGEVCIPDSYRTLGRLVVSVPGGPTVTLGVEGNAEGLPRCTDAFIGYHPEDIQINPLDVTYVEDLSTRQGYTLGAACSPDTDTWLGQSWLTYEVTGSTLCGVSSPSSVPAVWSALGLGDFQYGTVQLEGVSLARCRAALDPEFLAAYEAQFGALPPGSGGSDIGEPVSTPPPPDVPTEPPTEVVTQPPAECTAGWLPGSGCVCCGTTLTCADGTIAEFNPACMGGAPDVCGDGVCSPAEGAVCGTCSIDCGPC